MKILMWVAISLLTLMLALVIIVYSSFERSEETKKILKNHPDAYWSGAQDGGVFFEITKKTPPTYYVEIRHEGGGIWTKGWIRYSLKSGGELSSSDLLGYDGGDVVYLQDGTVLDLNANSEK